MAVTAAIAEILLGLNIEGLKRGFKKGASALGDFQKKLEANRQTFKRTAVVSGAMFAGQLFWLNKVTEEAGIQEQAENNLKTAVLAHEGATMADVEALKAQASALQEATKYGDEATIQAQAYLAELGVTPGKLKDATQATLDMAAALKMDLTAAARNVGKTMGGFAGELGEVIPELKNLTQAELRAGKGIDLLAEKFAGRAVEDAKNYTGIKQQLLNVIVDLNEELGFTFIPMLGDLAKKLIPLIKSSADWVKQNQDLVKWIVGIGIGGTGLVFGLSTMGYLLAGLPMLFAAVSGPIGIMIAGIVALAGAVIYFRNQGKKIPGTIEEINSALDEETQKLANLTAGKESDLRAGNRFVGGLRSEEEIIRDNAGAIAESEDYIKRLTKAKDTLTKQQEMENKALAIATDMMNQNKFSIDGLTQSQQENLNKLIEEKDALGILAFAQKVRSENDAFQLELDGLMRGSLEETNEGIQAQAENLLYLAGVWDIVKEKSQETTLQAGTDANEYQNILNELGSYMWTTFTGSFASAFLKIHESEKRFVVAFAKTWIMGLINVISNTIDMAIAKIIVQKMETLGMLTISGFMNPFNWAKIAPMLAASAGFIASLQALKGAIFKPQELSFQRGLEMGPVPRTGYYQLHEGERVFNPRINTIRQLETVTGQARGGGDIYLSPNFYGPIKSEIDINEASKILARDLLIARAT